MDISEPQSAEKQVLLLQHLVKTGLDALKPQPHLDSSYGFAYPEACAVFGTAPGEEIALLEQLADMGCLDRQFFDKIRLCGACQHYALNFREICASCDSANIVLEDILHHFRCGYTAPEAEFKDGIRYTCPKCKHQLRHIGVDYERPSTSNFCTACGNVFPDPKVSCQCLKCGHAFGVERALLRTLNIYHLTPQGTLVASEGNLNRIRKSLGIIDATLGIYTLAFFQARVEQELAGVRRYKRNLSLLLIGIDNLSDFQSAQGQIATAAKFQDFINLIREELRDSDVIALYEEHVLAALLPDTPLTGAIIAGDRIRKSFLKLNSSQHETPMTVSGGIVTVSPKELFAAKELLGIAHERLQEARRQGGNSVCSLS
jgi:diguanylate cyclase (GGDEF)-like protein